MYWRVICNNIEYEELSIHVIFWLFWTNTEKLYISLVCTKQKVGLEQNISNTEIKNLKKQVNVFPGLFRCTKIWTRIKNKNEVLDCRKGFNTIDHSIRLRKMNKINIKDPPLHLFQSYLINKYHYSKINEVDRDKN